MMNVLDALRYRLGATDLEGEPLDPVTQEMIRGSLVPPGLPLGVQDSIRSRPSYAEGETIPVPAGRYQSPDNPLFQQEWGAFQGRQREDRLNEDLDFGEYLRQRGQLAWPENSLPSGRPQGQSPFASPLNQLLKLGRRAPLSMY